jgi:hypothetical protein
MSLAQLYSRVTSQRCATYPNDNKEGSGNVSRSFSEQGKKILPSRTEAQSPCETVHEMITVSFSTFPSLLRKEIVYFRGQKNRLVPAQNHMNPFHTLIYCFYKIQINITSLLQSKSRAPKRSLPSVYPTKHINYKVLEIK